MPGSTESYTRTLQRVKIFKHYLLHMDWRASALPGAGTKQYTNETKVPALVELMFRMH